MVHCKENVPRRERTEIKWAASLPSLVWLVILSRCLTLRGTLGLASVSISTPTMMQGNDIHLWHPEASFPMLLSSAEYLTSRARLFHWLIMARGMFGHQAQSEASTKVDPFQSIVFHRCWYEIQAREGLSSFLLLVSKQIQKLNSCSSVFLYQFGTIWRQNLLAWHFCPFNISGWRPPLLYNNIGLRGFLCDVPWFVRYLIHSISQLLARYEFIDTVICMCITRP